MSLSKGQLSHIMTASTNVLTVTGESVHQYVQTFLNQQPLENNELTTLML